ncbi:MAG: membrane dipeptidase [Cytophagaceae bacterium]|nr:membrane dipeptidase [Gemmatimonadaceae bacterium]
MSTPRLLLTACLIAAASPLSAQDPHMAKALRVLRTTPLIDGHNDLPWVIRNFKASPLDVEAYDLTKRTTGHTDIARLRAGLVGGQFWSVYIPGDVRDSGYAKIQLEQIDIAQRVFRKYPTVFQPVLTASGIRQAFANHKIGSLMGMEGGHAIENSLGALRAYYGMGVRYMTLTHNVTLDWADAANGEQLRGGLTKFGEEVVHEMNRLGMLVDLSHTSPSTMSDALTTSAAPVIWSHACARAVTDVPRNVPDSILRRVPKNGGVVMITFVPGFLSQKVADYGVLRRAKQIQLQSQFGADSAAARAEMATWDREHPPVKATLQDVADHIDHVRKVAGVNHVGIGSDFDGVDDLPVGLEDVSKYPSLFAELSRRGWSETDLRKLAGENVLRALTQAERMAAKLQKERRPSTKTIQQLDGRPRM